MSSYARVTATHPENHAVDLVLVTDGARMSGVQVATSMASTTSGTVDMPEVGTPASGDKWSLTEKTSNDMLAIVDYVDGEPVVTGFLYPQDNQMLFTDGKRRVIRHQSGFYGTINGDGSHEWVHPSGTYIRLGVGAEHDDLSSKNADGSWNVDKNKDKQATLHIGMAGGKASITISPNGAMNIVTADNVNIEVQGTTSLKTAGLEIDTPNAHFTGDIHADGDVVAGTVSLRHHVNTGVIGGPDNSGPPNGG